MKPAVLVTGATGRIGGTVARRLVGAGHRVRAFVRNPAGERAEALERAGVELAPGDLEDQASSAEACTGMDAVFIVTTPLPGVDVEVVHGKTMASAAAAAGVQHIVLSSVADAQRGTGIPHFESKHAIEAHLRTLGVVWTAVAPAFFYENVLFPWNLEGLKAGVWRQPLPPNRPLKMITVRDIAAFVALVIDHPGEFAGQHVDIASDELTGAEVAEALTAVIGEPIRYVEQDLKEVRDQFDDMATMYEWLQNTGFSIDIQALRTRYPQVQWTPFPNWARTINWPRLLGRGEA